MNIDITIPGYLPVRNINNSILSNLLAGSIIEALVMEVNSENMLLKLPDGSILNANADTLDNSLKNQNSNLDTTDYDKLNTIKDFKSNFRIGETLKLKVISNDSKLLLLKNMNTKSAEDYSVSVKSHIGHANDASTNKATVYKFNYNSKDIGSASNAFNYYRLGNEILSKAAKNKGINFINNKAAISNTEIAGNEASSIGNNISASNDNGIDINSDTLILVDNGSQSEALQTSKNDMFILKNTSSENYNDREFKNFISSLNSGVHEINTDDLALYKYLFATIAEKNENFESDITRNNQIRSKDFLSRNMLKNELLNKNTLREIVKTLNSLKKLDTTKLLNSVKTADLRFSENGNRLNLQNANYDNRNNISGNNLNNGLLYMEIPIQYSGQKSSGKLYFIRKKSSGSKQNKKTDRSESFTACLLLDFQRMGLIQTIISLKQKAITINIKVETQNIANFIKDNYQDLFNELSNAGYQLLNFKCELMKDDISRSKIEENIVKELQGSDTVIDFRI